MDGDERRAGGEREQIQENQTEMAHYKKGDFPTDI